MPKAVAAKHKVFPYRVRGKTLTLLMVDPNDHGTVARIGYALGYIIRTAVVPEFRMIQLLRDYYGVDERWRFTDTHRAAIAARRDPPTAATAAARARRGGHARRGGGGAARGVPALLPARDLLHREGAVGAGLERRRARASTARLVTGLRIPLDQPSIFRTVTRDRSLFIGRLGPEEENQRLLKALGKRPQSTAVVLPVSLRSRVVNLVYGDNGPDGTGAQRPGRADGAAAEGARARTCASSASASPTRDRCRPKSRTTWKGTSHDREARRRSAGAASARRRRRRRARRRRRPPPRSRPPSAEEPRRGSAPSAEPAREGEQHQHQAQRDRGGPGQPGPEARARRAPTRAPPRSAARRAVPRRRRRRCAGRRRRRAARARSTTPAGGAAADRAGRARARPRRRRGRGRSRRQYELSGVPAGAARAGVPPALVGRVPLAASAPGRRTSRSPGSSTRASGDPFYLGLRSFVADAPLVAFMLVGGAVADRVDRRRILLTSQVLQMTFAAVLAVLYVTDRLDVAPILADRVPDRARAVAVGADLPGGADDGGAARRRSRTRSR